jgi:DNA-binding FadR family transcriptional regulator
MVFAVARIPTETTPRHIEPVSGNLETAGQAAARVICDRILTGELGAGTKLNQHELAADLGMSRIPVRDALRSLAGEEPAAGQRRSLDMIRVIRRQTDRYTAVHLELNHTRERANDPDRGSAHRTHLRLL